MTLPVTFEKRDHISEELLLDRIAGVLLGTAVGDALGLPMENLSPERIRRRWRGPLRMSFIFERGMISDDTEHTLMVAQALLAEADNAAKFQRVLGWKFRWWFAGLPGGVGLATAKACLKLWLGFPPRKAAVASAGSGPAMRSAILGAYFSGDSAQRKAFVLASAQLTHRSWQAEVAALAVAEAAVLAMKGEVIPEEAFAVLRGLSSEPEWLTRLSQAEKCLSRGASVADYAGELGLQKGVTGYSMHVVPVAIYAWLRHPNDMRTALTETIGSGGDTDTVGAILGGLMGASVGLQGVPSEWSERIWEWPRSKSFMLRLGKALAEKKQTHQSVGTVSYFWPALIPRNLLFLVTVLLHGFRRLLPPY